MKNFFLNKSLHFVTKYNDYSKNDIEKLKYGLEGIYLTLTKLVIIILLSLILHIWKEVLLILLFFNIIRYFGFGVHANKSSECLVSSILCFIFLPYILLNIYLSVNAKIIIGIICLINFIIFAPADTIKRPMKNKKKKLIRKLFTCLLSIIYTICSVIIINKMISTVLIISIIIEAIFVNPISYFVLKQPCNNYKKI